MDFPLRYWRQNARVATLVLVAAAGLLGLLLYKLGSLVGGLSGNEVHAANAAVGWHGIFHDPLYLPLKLVRSVVFFVAPEHGQLLTRLPNVVFGFITGLSFAWLIWQWHGRRTAILTTLMFATSAWVLHASRLASFDVLYLWAIPTMLVMQVLLHRHWQRPAVWYGSLLLWGMLLYIPGLIWLLLAQLYIQREMVKKAWQHFGRWWQRLLSAGSLLIWLPLLAIGLSRPGKLVEWLGLPSHVPSIWHLLKGIVAVPLHLVVRGPQYPELWLDKTPVLDIFTLVVAGLGIYFYATHWQSSRTRTLGSLLLVGGLLVGIGGAVSLSLLIPLLYVAAATGVTYLLHDWLKVFPLNPLARGLGIGLVSLAVVLSALYNLRAYYVAWPHNHATPPIFRYHR